MQVLPVSPRKKKGDEPASEEETFWFASVGWDVEKAKKIIERAPRDPVALNVADLTSHLMWVRVDEARAKALPADVLVLPVIVGWLPPMREDPPGKTGRFLIDGHHRLWRHVAEKRPTILAYLLTPEENKLIELGGAWRTMRAQHRAAHKKGSKT